MKKFNNWFNEIWDLDSRLRPWQSILITTVFVVLMVCLFTYLYVMDK